MNAGFDCKVTSRRSAFVYVDLVVVVAIIGALLGLLLPALQAAREASRNSQCKNHLRRIAIGCLEHEKTQISYPYSGWSFGWMGDPDQGVGPQQPGSWVYTTGRYIDFDASFDIGAGLPWPAKKVALAQQLATVLPDFYCPSRRPAVAYPAYSNDGRTCDNGIRLKNADLPAKVAKTDYAINGGNQTGWNSGAGGSGGAPSESCLHGNGLSSINGEYPNCGWHLAAPNEYWQRFNGVSGWRTAARVGQIIDGLSKTVLVGEKFVQPRFYEHSCPMTGSAPSKGNSGDNSSLYVGWDIDIARTGYLTRDFNPPSDDSVGASHFGSAHPNAANFAFCDGSVRSIRYDVANFQQFIDRGDATVVAELAN